MKKNVLIILFSLLLFKNTSAEKEVIVFIHGTIGPLTSMPTTKKELKELFGKSTKKINPKKNIFSRFYQRYINQCRTDGIHKYQPISDLNLKKFGEGSNKKQLKKFKKLFTKNFEQIGKNKEYLFYTFGWEGTLDHELRKKWGQILYKQLTTKFTNNEKIQIYAHSHGGNVALNLVPAEKKYKKNLKIEKLILLGVPVQKNTQNFIKSKIFKNVYNFYSNGDYMQTLENKFFVTNKTKRKFHTKNKNIKQIEITCGKQKPSHWELWFYGKTNSNVFQNFLFKKIMYSNKFPLYPYPASIFVPLIINKIESEKKLQKTQLYLDINKGNTENNFIIKIETKKKNPLHVEFKYIQN